MCGCSPSLLHRLRLAAGAGERRLADVLGVVDGDRDLALAVVDVAGAIDALAPAAPEEALDPVAAGDQLRGVARRGGRCRSAAGSEPRAAFRRSRRSGPQAGWGCRTRGSASAAEDTAARV